MSRLAIRIFDGQKVLIENGPDKIWISFYKAKSHMRASFSLDPKFKITRIEDEVKKPLDEFANG